MLKKITALFVVTLMICISVSAVYASESAFVKSVMIDGAPKYELCVGETLTLEAVAPIEGADFAYIVWGTDKEGVVEIQHLGDSTTLSITIDAVKITALSLGEITLTAYASLDSNVDKNNYEKSHSVIIEVVESKIDTTLPTEIEKMYNVSYHTDVSHFNNDIEGKITSYEELANQFSNYEEILSKYDETFFENKFLYRIGVRLGDPSWEIEVVDVTNTEGLIEIELISTKKPGDFPQIIVPWDIVLEFDNSYLDKTILSEIKQDWYIDTIYSESFGKSDAALIKVRYYPNDKKINVGDSELYYNSQKDAYFGLVDANSIDLTKQSMEITTTTGTPTTFTYGNLVANSRDEANISDLHAMKLIIEKNILPDERFLVASDLNGDGRCNITDLQAMKQYIEMGIDFPVLN